MSFLRKTLVLNVHLFYLSLTNYKAPPSQDHGIGLRCKMARSSAFQEFVTPKKNGRSVKGTGAFAQFVTAQLASPPTAYNKKVDDEADLEGGLPPGQATAEAHQRLPLLLRLSLIHI